MPHKKSGKQLDREIAAAMHSHATTKQTLPKITDAELMKRLEVRAHPRSADTMYLEWFALPRELRGKGLGRRAYKLWEKTVPKEFKLIQLHAADSGSGPTDAFWERMGFQWRFDFGEPVYSASDPRYEASHEMQKGIHGKRTPDLVDVPNEDGEDDEDRDQED
jgi:hypothetical protein